MGALTLWTVVVVVAALLVHRINRSPLLPPHFDGTVHTKFKYVQDVFRQNFADGWEPAGAALAVYHKGRLVVDVWGGYADAEAMRLWTRDTTTVVWSSTKALTSLAMAKLVDDGHCAYDDLVTTYWPQFGAHGKANVTIAMVMSHQAGLAAIDHDIDVELAGDHERMGAILADQRPNWPPGTGIGYHAQTFGWIVSQIVARVDPKRRTLGVYVKEEIMAPLDIVGCHIGLPVEAEHTVARMVFTDTWDVLATLTQSWPILQGLSMLLLYPPPLFARTTQNPHFAFGNTFRHLNGYNSPDVRRLENGASGGICTARALAAPFNALLRGELLSPAAMETHKDPLFFEKIDLVMGLPESHGMGWMYAKNPKSDGWYVGHSGYGDQYVAFDVKHEIAFAYVSNALKAGVKDSAIVSKKLIRAIYDAL